MRIRKRLEGLAREALWDCAAAFMIAAGLSVFAAGADFAPGGVNGLSLIIRHLFELPMGAVSLVLNGPVILMTYKLLGRDFLLKSLKSMVICAVFMDYVIPFVPPYHGNQLLAALFAGAFNGAGLALIYLQNSSTGGSDFLILSVKKLKPHLSIGQITQIIDGSVIVLGGFVFRNIEAVLYGIVCTAVTTAVIDRIMNGACSGKTVMIITESGRRIAAEIDRAMGRGATIMRATGGYSGTQKDAVLCVCSHRQIPQVRRVVQGLDGNAFVIVGEFTQVYGEGFQKLEEN